LEDQSGFAGQVSAKGGTMPGQAAQKRKLELDLGELEAAFEEDISWEVNHYLDLETGHVVAITSDTRQALEDLYQELDDEGIDQADWQAAIQQRDLPDWEKNELLLADQVEAGYGTRYISIPEVDSHQAYEDMQDFIATVQKQSLQDRLWNAISCFCQSKRASVYIRKERHFGLVPESLYSKRASIYIRKEHHPAVL
jgi:hypothetical protein